MDEGVRMKLKEAQAVKKQLQQLDAELRRFKAELLNARVAEIEKVIRSPGGRVNQGTRRL